MLLRRAHLMRVAKEPPPASGSDSAPSAPALTAGGTPPSCGPPQVGSGIRARQPTAALACRHQQMLLENQVVGLTLTKSSHGMCKLLPACGSPYVGRGSHAWQPTARLTRGRQEACDQAPRLHHVIEGPPGLTFGLASSSRADCSAATKPHRRRWLLCWFSTI